MKQVVRYPHQKPDHRILALVLEAQVISRHSVQWDENLLSSLPRQNKITLQIDRHPLIQIGISPENNIALPDIHLLNPAHRLLCPARCFQSGGLHANLGDKILRMHRKVNAVLGKVSAIVWIRSIRKIRMFLPHILPLADQPRHLLIGDQVITAAC